MIAFLSIVMIFVHLAAVVFFSRKLENLNISIAKATIFAFIITGLLFGVITAIIGSSTASLVVNPLGVRVADWLYRIWDPALHNPDLGREPSIPWVLHAPQSYIFITPLLYACIGLLSRLSKTMSSIDPRRYLIPDIELEEEEEEEKEEQPAALLPSSDK